MNQKLMTFTKQRPTIDERFSRWMSENPGAYDLFRRYALEVLRSGKERYSADMIASRIRWHEEIELGRESGFKINNDFTSRLARLLMERDEQFRGFFETRQLKPRRS